MSASGQKVLPNGGGNACRFSYEYGVWRYVITVFDPRIQIKRGRPWKRIMLRPHVALPKSLRLLLDPVPKVPVAPIFQDVATRLDDVLEVMVTRLELMPQDVRTLASYLSEDELQRAKLFFGRDRRRFIIAKARLRQVLSTRVRTLFGSVDF